MSPGVVELTGVTKSFPALAGRRHVLTGVDLRIGRGEIVAVAGRSGSGKTTLLTLVAGWDQPDGGTVSMPGADTAAASAPARLAWGDTAIVPQSLGLLDELTVAENVTLPLRLGRRTAGDPLPLMRQLGIDHLADRYPSEISLGERQRASVARAAVLRPRLLVADEPIAHQNVERATAIMAALRHLADQGSACLVATHNQLALDAADRVLELRAGQLHPAETS